MYLLGILMFHWQQKFLGNAGKVGKMSARLRSYRLQSLLAALLVQT